MRRTEQREHILRVIFGTEFYPPEELDEQIDLYFEQTGIDDEKDRAYIGEKAKKIAKILYAQALLMADLPLENPGEYTDLVCELVQ